ncbi:hypothetical protein [Luteolibacter sp. Populi]|uniref:hypothetical protein n=1 Tax=Luteolibacter sp. Populi TaxID=3230487 RepID=UPI0034672C38
MKSFLHAFRLTFRRFRWEILGYWILSIAVVAIAATNPPPLEYMRSGSRGIVPDYSKLEILAACWLILRLVLSEPVFLTQGGWGTRPLGRTAVWAAPFAVLALALLPSLLARLVAIAALTKPDIRVWGDLFLNNLLVAMLVPALAAVLVRSIGGALWGKDPGPARKAACGILALLALTAWLHPLTARYLYQGRRGMSWSGAGTYSYGILLPALREELPAGVKFHDTGSAYWRLESGMKTTPQRELLRLAPVEGAVARGKGVALRILRVEPRGDRLEMDIAVTLAQGNLRNPKPPTLLLHFPGNHYSFRQRGGLGQTTYRLEAFPVFELRCDGSYEAPEEHPDWEWLLPQLEIVAFGNDYSRPPFFHDPSKEEVQEERNRDPKPEELPPLPPGIAGEVTEVFNGLDYDRDWNKREPMKAKGETIPYEGMPHVLARHPWSDTAWNLFVKSFLLKHAAESDKPALLERMTTEPRLGEIFIAKGWKTEAMPLLRGFCQARLPLDAVSLGALIEEKDPALAADIAALVARLPGDLSSFEPRLREYPGFDWAGFVSQGWRLRKYAYRREVQTPPFDRWAARQGDAIALQFVAEKAARGESGYEDSLRGLIAGQPQDAIGYARTNLGKMKFDAGTRTWSGSVP